jgi:integrase
MLERMHAQVSASGYSRSVWVQVRTVLKQSLDVAVRRGKVTSNVVLIAPQPGPRVLSQRYLSEDEARRVIAGCGSPAQRARWLLALSTGLRQGETLGLRWSDLDLDAELPTLRVERTLQRITGQGLITVPPKTRKSRRTLQLADPLVHALRHHRLTQRETMLALGAPWRPNGFVATSSGAALDPANDRKHWLARLESADVPHARLHDARDTAASLMIGAGVDIHVVGTVLGHSSTSTTADIYGHVPGRTAGAAIAAAVSLLSR